MEKITIEITADMIIATGVTVDIPADAFLESCGEQLKGALLNHLYDEVHHIMENN